MNIDNWKWLTIGLLAFALLTVLPCSHAGENGVRLPTVETGFQTTDPFKPRKASFAEIIPPDSIAKIVLLREHRLGKDWKDNFDVDKIFAELVASETVGTGWGIDALESLMAEFLIVTKEFKVYRVVILSQAFTTNKAVSGVLLHGKGFSCRFDFREDPLEVRPAEG